MGNPNKAHFGYVFFTQTIDEQVDLAVLAEQLGFDAMWAGEHIVLPVGTPSIYTPGPSDDEPTRSAGLPRSIYDEKTRFWDLIALMAAIARETKRMSLITGIYLAGLRHPLMTAGSIATLHQLSCGRFQLGVGAGWNRGEYEALGGNFEDRGNILDETVDILKTAMRGGPIEYHGRHYSFDPVMLTQQPFRVPILFGGHSAPALRRAARVGDGWISSLANDVNELVELTRTIDRLREEMGTADRPFHHWIKLTTIDPMEIERLQGLGMSRFQLVGEEIWGPRDASFGIRSQRLKGVAAALGLEAK